MLSDGADFKRHVDAVARAARSADRNGVDAGVLLHHLGVEGVAARGQNDVLGVDGDRVTLLVLGDDARDLAVLEDQLFGRRLEKQLAALGLELLDHGLGQGACARIDVPGLVGLFTPGGLHFLPVHAVVPDPLDRFGGFIDEGLDERRVDGPVMVGGHVVEGLDLRELDARFLLHEGFGGKRAFHEVAGAAREGVLFEKEGLEAAFDGGKSCDGTARTGADHDEVDVVGLIGGVGRSKAHCNGGGKNDTLHNLFSFGQGNRSRGELKTASLSMTQRLFGVLLKYFWRRQEVGPASPSIFGSSGVLVGNRYPL